MSKIPECPTCKSTDDIRYIEDIQNWRRVLGVTAGGVLLVASRYFTGEGWDDGSNARFFCGKCCAEFPIPEELCIDWVSDSDYPIQSGQ